mgnify:CR=1 FL=1
MLAPLYICLACHRLCEPSVISEMESGDDRGPYIREAIASDCCNDAADMILALPCDVCKDHFYPWLLDEFSGLCPRCFRADMAEALFEPLMERPIGERDEAGNL